MVADNQNSITAGPRGPVLLQDYQLLEKLAHQNRERIPERTVHAKGWGAFGTLTITNDVSRYTKAKVFSEVGKKTEVLARFSTVAGEMGAAEPEILAHQLALLMDGAIVAAMVSRDPGVADMAGLAAGSLFVPSKLKKQRRAGNAPAQLMAV